MADKAMIVDRLLSGKIKLHEVDKYVDDVVEAVATWLTFAETISGTSLSHLSRYSLDMKRLHNRNIENPIGAIQIPVGIVGPLKLRGKHAQGDFHVPLATSEGALLASVSRGCSILAAAGGAVVRIVADKMTRGPVLKAPSLDEAVEIRDWMVDHFPDLKKAAEATTQYGKLVKIDPIAVVGRYVYPRFVFSTGDSMGMNMVTIAAGAALDVLTRHINARVIAMSGNFCVDKKPAALNIIEGRGKTLIAEVVVPEPMVREKLRTSVDDLMQVNMAKNFIGSAISGSMEFNSHYANMISALFLATGQDMAHIVEGSLGITGIENLDGDLYFSITLPDLPIATVGGGTSLETARECLEIMGVYGSGKVQKFAEIAAGIVLAGELSTMSALASGHLIRAHKQLGRG